MDRIGPYIVDRKLGTGGMGTVYLATHEETGERAAVKVLPASLAREAGFRARFDREITALRQLDNPHVVKIFDSGTVAENPGDDPAYYYAMEYVEGETLLAKLRRERRLAWPVVIDYGAQICSALKAAHDAGIVHRDLKPSNLLVSEDGNVKLADFGVAQIFASSRLTKTGGVIGTAEFMSPEQAQGQRATRKSDLYSLGAVLYTMLVGKPPYSGQTMLDVLHKHRFGQFDRPRHYAPDCPSWLEEIVCQLLDKNPDKRPADAYVTGKRLREVVKKVELSQSEPLPAYLPGKTAGEGPPTGQEILSHEEDAGGGEAEYAGDAPTRTAPGLTSRNTPIAGRGPGEATIMHSLMREELSRQQELHPVQKLLDNVWVLIGLLGLLIVGGMFWYRSLPTPEWHLTEARRLLAEPAGPAWTTARTEHLQPLYDEGGEWREAAEPLLEMVRRWEKENPPPVRRLRNARNDDPADNGVPDRVVPADGEAGRLLSRASTARDRGDVAKASRLLQAFLAVTAGQEQFALDRERAIGMLEELPDAGQSAAEKRQFIAESLARARELRATGQAEQAAAIEQGLRTLYGDDPTVSDLLDADAPPAEEQNP